MPVDVAANDHQPDQAPNTTIDIHTVLQQQLTALNPADVLKMPGMESKTPDQITRGAKKLSNDITAGITIIENSITDAMKTERVVGLLPVRNSTRQNALLEAVAQQYLIDVNTTAPTENNRISELTGGEPILEDKIWILPLPTITNAETGATYAVGLNRQTNLSQQPHGYLEPGSSLFTLVAVKQTEGIPVKTEAPPPEKPVEKSVATQEPWIDGDIASQALEIARQDLSLNTRAGDTRIGVSPIKGWFADEITHSIASPDNTTSLGTREYVRFFGDGHNQPVDYRTPVHRLTIFSGKGRPSVDITEYTDNTIVIATNIPPESDPTVAKQALQDTLNFHQDAVKAHLTKPKT